MRFCGRALSGIERIPSPQNTAECGKTKVTLKTLLAFRQYFSDVEWLCRLLVARGQLHCMEYHGILFIVRTTASFEMTMLSQSRRLARSMKSFIRFYNGRRRAAKLVHREAYSNVRCAFRLLGNALKGQPPRTRRRGPSIRRYPRRTAARPRRARPLERKFEQSSL